MLAYRIQEDAFGGLDRDTAKLLDRLARGEKPSELNRRLKAGTVLVREYQGERHTVTVTTEGFVWRDTTYSSLSMIAHVITGTRWNGPRFFGLRTAGKPKGAAPAKNHSERNVPKQNRSSVQVSRAGNRGGSDYG
jgi:hypothetical protein